MATKIQKRAIRFLASGFVTSFFLLACSHTVTVYWTKPGAGPQELEQDKEDCRLLQRTVGNSEDRIDQCLVVKGWSEVKKETTMKSPPSP